MGCKIDTAYEDVFKLGTKEAIVNKVLESCKIDIEDC